MGEPPDAAATIGSEHQRRVFCKVLFKLWADAVAAGEKVFECAKPGKLADMVTGDLLIIGCTGAKGYVVAVGEVDYMVKAATEHEYLFHMLSQRLIPELCRFCEDAEMHTFDYVKFRRVFDVRPMAWTRSPRHRGP